MSTSPEEFRRITACFGGCALLLDGQGTVIATERCGEIESIPLLRPKVRLSELFDDTAGMLTAYLRDCARSGQPVLGTLRWTLSDGTPRSIRCTGSLIATANDPAERRIILRLDLEERQRENFRLLNLKIAELERALHRRTEAEEALRAERERLQVTLASIGDGVVVTDAQGCVTFLNPVAEKLTGWATAEASGRPLGDVFRIENEYSREIVESPVERVLREGLVIGLANHTVLIAKDRTERPIDDSAAPIRMADGRLAGVVLVFRDVSDRKLIEEERRTADRRKDEFLAMLAHELRNPLTPISNALHAWPFVKEDPVEMERLRETMARQTQQMTRLIDDLLDVSRVSRGTVSLRPQLTDLRSVVDAAIESVRPQIAARQQTLEVQLADPAPRLHGDVVRLVQVFVNLLSNASKYTDDGGRIELTAELADSNGPVQAVVAISDTGCGISAEMLPRVFDMFAQADQALDRAQGGLGIGLTLVKTLVELHNGTVEAFSDGLGAGSTFVVKLPAAQSAEFIAAAPEAIEPLVALPSLKVLVVDDLSPSARTLALMLKGIGQSAAVANDGPSALSALETFAADMVLLDIGMPNMDGYEVCRRIRASFAEREAERPAVVALTGYGQEEDRRKAFAAGFDKHLVKPTSVAELKQLVGEIAARRSASH